MYRKQDIKFLQDIYDRDSNDIAVLYGRAENGLAHITADFIKDKECLYYKACAVNDVTQRQLFAQELFEQTKTPYLPNDDYGDLIRSFINSNPGKKKLVVLEDFQYILKENPTCINYLANLLTEKTKSGSAMFLLISDNVRWVETDMVKMIGRKSSEISGVIKLNDYSPAEIYEQFPKMPLSELIGIYSVLGGRSVYYDTITDESVLKSVVIEKLESFMYIDHSANPFLWRDIREPSLYNTILVNLAKGRGKLNDLHGITGVDRAKLAVYLKTLVEYGLVEKIISAQVGNANTQKGTYRICPGLASFYYRFVFPHASSLITNGPERFYRRHIEHELYSYIDEMYMFFCMEHIKWLRDNGRLNFKVASVEEYHDRDGAVDFVIVAAGGSVIACSCSYSANHMNSAVYENVKAAVKKNRINCDNIWLFSAGGFDQKLTMLESVSVGLKLIEGKDQRLR